MQCWLSYTANYIVDLVDFDRGSELLTSFDCGLPCNGKSFYNKLWGILMMLLHNAIVVFITIIKIFMIKAYVQIKYKINDVRHREFHWFHRFRHCSPGTILGFLQFLWYKNRLISCTAIIQFCFLYIEFNQFYCSCRHSQTGHNPSSFSNFCDARISRSPVTLSSLDCSSCILPCISARWF